MFTEKLNIVEFVTIAIMYYVHVLSYTQLDVENIKELYDS